MLTTAQALATIIVIALVTLLTRALPFLLFPGNKETPHYIQYLGKTLPCAAIGMLVVYCLKGVSMTEAPYGLPEAIAMIFVITVHLWKHNTLLSIGGGTVLYMFLVQQVF